MITILTSLGFVLDENRSVQVPRRRGTDDINLPEDIYEEIIRIDGYDRIPSLPLRDTVTYKAPSASVYIIRALEEVLTHYYHADQLQSYPRTQQKILELFEFDTKNLVKLRNAVAPELAYLRPSILPNLLEFVRKNSKVEDEFTMYDHGQTRNKSEKLSRYLTKQSFETSMLGIISYQHKSPQLKEDGLLQQKAMIQTIITKLGLLGDLEYQSSSENFYHPTKQGTIFFVPLTSHKTEKKPKNPKN